MSAPTETVAETRVERIKVIHRELENIKQTVLGKAAEAGRLLIEAKQELPHGAFLPWLKANFEFSDRTARRYMDIAELEAKGKLDSSVSDLTAAYQIATDSKPPTKKRTPHVSHNTGNNEWYTPGAIIESARRVMGGIEVDPASCEIANERVKAKRFFTKADDGLKQAWAGRVWMNPPYAQPLIAQFAEAVSEKYESGEIDEAIVLVNNATETRWFQRMATTASAVCSLRSRVKFLDPDGNSRGTPPQGQAVLYFGNRSAHFSDEFERWGSIWRKPSVPEPEVVVEREDKPSPDRPEPYDAVLEALPKMTDDQRTQLGRILVTRWNVKIEEVAP